MTRSVDVLKLHGTRPGSVAQGTSPSGLGQSGFGSPSPGGSLGTGDNADLWTPGVENGTGSGGIVEAFDTGTIIWDAACRDPQGRLYLVSGILGATNRAFYYFPTPETSLASPTSTTLGVPADPACAIYDSNTDRVYFGSRANQGSGQKNCTIWRVVPSTGAMDTVVTNQGRGTNASAGTSSSICTDGTYLYEVYACSNVSSFLMKWRISDGTQVASIQIGNSPGGTTTNGSGIILYSGNLYVVGNGLSGGGAWAAKAPTSLASITSVVSLSAAIVNDDFVTDGAGNFFFGDEGLLSPTPNITKLDTSLNATTITVTGDTDAVDGIYYDSSTGYLWTCGRATGSVNVVRASDGAVIHNYTHLVGSGYFDTNKHANEIFPTALGYLVVTFDASQATNSYVLRVNV